MNLLLTDEEVVTLRAALRVYQGLLVTEIHEWVAYTANDRETYFHTVRDVNEILRKIDNEPTNPEPA